MKITTQQCISILKFINAMGIKKDLIDGIKKIMTVNKNIDLINRTIASKLNDKTNVDEVAKFLMENPSVREERDRLSEEQQGVLLELVYLIIEGIPRAEDIFYKTIAEIKNVEVEEIKNADGLETVKTLQEIVNSDTFMGFFQLQMK